MKLTDTELNELQAWLNMGQVGNMPVERPVVAPVPRLGRGEHPVPIGSRMKLSEATEKRMQRMELKKEKHKAAVAARAAKLPRGRYSHKRKEQTKRRAALRRWKRQPYKSTVYSYGNWNITEEEWNQHLGDYWQLYDAKHLRIKRKWGKGTKLEPYVIWDLKLYYKDKLLWDGERERWIHLSAPNSLDIEKAPEGAQLFADDSLSIKHVKIVWRGQKGLFIPEE